MSTVRGVTIDEHERGRGWTPEVDARMAALETPIRRLLEPRTASLADADRITLVPDAHYPFHPSSGVVTDPAVIGALVAYLERETSAAIAVAGSSEYVSAERTGEYLGYDDVLERFDASLFDPADAPRNDETVRLGDQPVALAVPDRLASGSVIPVPALRPTRDGPIAGGMRTLARHVDCSIDGGVAGAAAAAVVDPELAVLDATIAYAGEPYAAETLFAGPTAAVDAVGARLLDRSLADDEALEYGLGAGDPDGIRVDGVDVAALRDRCPSGELPPPTDPHPAVSIAYRTYAAVSGDGVPPQLDGR
ncbi:hypothetical protein ACFO5R_07485 [Halosolutus amylolyticus]|uniref:DUF362 domain-containing protein n=1 Tax=Halosolutus amylolyticus TaxID=2932267 RepID=A0ABD5PML0_9EURY|nr:hypothetical protein [Halosolutus amylolyticus]